MMTATVPLPQPVFTGRIREIVILFMPIAIMTFSDSLVFFVEKLFFGQLSAEVMEVAIGVAYVSRIFQSPCMALAMMAQVYVGRLQGAHNEAAIGSHIWQYIWFSLLSILITFPLSLVCGRFYFQGTILEGSFFSYFILLTSINFLYPLGASLSSFYLGRGKTRLILFTTIATHILSLFLAYLFIFGVDGWIPSLGLIGGGLSILIGQGTFCLILLYDFLSEKYALKYGSRNWRFHLTLFYACIFPGFLRALNAISLFICWAFISHLMIEKQGDYLLIWSIGSTIGLFLPFIGNAICQAMTTIASNMVGARNFPFLQKLDLSGVFVISTIILLMSIPLLMFPDWTFHFLFPSINLSSTSIKNIFFGLWLSFSFGTFSYISVSRILAFKDTKFLLMTGSCCWINGFLMMYLAVNVLNIPADQCWIVLSFTNLFDLCIFSWRAKYLTSKKILMQAS